MFEKISHLLFLGYTWVLTIWWLIAVIGVPVLIIYLLFKHRKNKDEIIKILKPVVAFILFVSFYFLLRSCVGY